MIKIGNNQLHFTNCATHNVQTRYIVRRGFGKTIMLTYSLILILILVVPHAFRLGSPA